MASQEAYRIAVADDHPLFRQGLRKFSMKSKNIEVVAEAETGSNSSCSCTKCCPTW